MGIAIPRIATEIERLRSEPAPQIHWPSAILGLALAVTIVVGVAWVAASQRPRELALTPDRTVAAAPAPLLVSAEPKAVAIPTPIPPPPVHEPAAAIERVKVANTRGLGVNLRAAAGERGARVKTLTEGTALEALGPEERVDGVVWRQVREPGGATGWVAASYVARQ